MGKDKIIQTAVLITVIWCAKKEKIKKVQDTLITSPTLKNWKKNQAKKWKESEIRVAHVYSEWVPGGDSRDQQRLKSEAMMLGREDQHWLRWGHNQYTMVKLQETRHIDNLDPDIR